MSPVIGSVPAVMVEISLMMMMVQDEAATVSWCRCLVGHDSSLADMKTHGED